MTAASDTMLMMRELVMAGQRCGHNRAADFVNTRDLLGKLLNADRGLSEFDCISVIRAAGAVVGAAKR